MVLETHTSVEDVPLELMDIPVPTPANHEVLLKVKACGICHTDLHIIEEEVRPPKLPIVIGHQVVGVVVGFGTDVTGRKIGERVGVPWVSSPCDNSGYCYLGEENLCDNIRFTGFDINGGLAEYMVAPADFVYQIPGDFPDVQATPLLCAGIRGFRAL